MLQVVVVTVCGVLKVVVVVTVCGMLQVMLCVMSGLLVTLVYWSSSWVVGQTEMMSSTGPMQGREWGLLEVWAGLHHLNLSYVTQTMAITETVVLSSRADLARTHLKALQDGWPWPLVSITAELAGEGLAWDGLLGGGLMHAGGITSWMLEAALYVWGVWVMLFFMAPQLTPIPLMLCGVLTCLATVSYAACVGSRLPTVVRVGGVLMELHLGLAWWLTAGLSLTLTFAGIVMHIYNLMYPGHISTIFELDFGGEVTSHDPPWDRVGPLLAYETSPDTYTQLYPPGNYPTFVQHTQVSTHVLSERQDSGCNNNNAGSNTRKDSHNDETSSRLVQNTAKHPPDYGTTSTISRSGTSGSSPEKQSTQRHFSTSSIEDNTSSGCVRMSPGFSLGGQVRPKFCTKIPSSRSHSKLRSFRFSSRRYKTPPTKSHSSSWLVDFEAASSRNVLDMEAVIKSAGVPSHQRRYCTKLWKTFTDCFNCLPIAAIIDEKIFCCHGGLSPDLRSMEQISCIMRPTDVPDTGLLCDLLWSDPDNDVSGWGENDRGVSFTFGSDVVTKFLNRHDLDLICRAHQVVEDGYEFFAKRQLVTIFSAPNYCGEFDNAGGMMSIDEDLLCSFQIIKPSEKKAKHQYTALKQRRPPPLQANRSNNSIRSSTRKAGGMREWRDGGREQQLGAVPPLTFIKKAVNSIDGGTLMVATEKEEVLWILDLVGKEEADGLKGLFASIHIKPSEKAAKHQYTALKQRRPPPPPASQQEQQQQRERVKLERRMTRG
ncbi:hypothetical protein Pcinc_025249 [Petrolisthes cinctipes]|uniref:protein-serine/threonine phosphatase n=1 Tax=Petrolisthes cinctipes TaxID=88211 RepID=A0AAE1FB04_PETCI|nr:hypothetical protein Pcinc_025249 [Petrolisthes cinctipes]